MSIFLPSHDDVGCANEVLGRADQAVARRVQNPPPLRYVARSNRSDPFNFQDLRVEEIAAQCKVAHALRSRAG